METWLIYSLFAVFAFGVVNFLFKFVVGKAPTYLIVLTLYLSATAVAIVLFVKSGVSFKMPLNITLLAIFAGVLVLGALLSVFAALKTGAAVRVIPIINLNTLVTVVLAVLILHEKVNFKIGLGIILALVSLYLLAS